MTNQTELTAERVERAISIQQELMRDMRSDDVDEENRETAEEVAVIVETVVLPVLRAEQERNKGCMYCVGFGISSATVKSDFGFSEKMKRINFCPYCGRRLPEGSAE